MESAWFRSLASSSTCVRAIARLFTILDISLDIGSKMPSLGSLNRPSAFPLCMLFIHSDIWAMGPMMLQRTMTSVITEMMSAFASILIKFLRQIPDICSSI